MRIVFLFTSFLLCINNNAQIKVSCTGTSITAGYGIADSLSYPSQLQNILSEDVIGNFGVSASTILHKTKYPYISYPNYINAQYFNPNIVTIEFGTNDSQPQNWNNYKDSFVADYTRFINVFKALETHPVIYACVPIPAISSLYGINDSTITYEIIPLIKSIVINNDIKLIDLNTPFIGHAELYQPDGIHPNAKGAKKLAQIISQAIAAPEDLTASVTGMHGIKLNWIINNNETGFTIQRSNDSIKWHILYNAIANLTTHTDSKPPDSIRYYYRIRATIASGNTVYSDVVSAVPNYINTLVPSITSSSSANGVVNASFHYAITATNKPAGYTATGLPQGLILNTSTGKITGKPVIAEGSGAATFIVLLKATNTYGNITKALKIYISPAALIAKNKLPVFKNEN